MLIENEFYLMVVLVYGIWSILTFKISHDEEPGKNSNKETQTGFNIISDHAYSDDPKIQIKQ